MRQDTEHFALLKSIADQAAENLTLLQRIAALKAERDALRQDAQRYRWLRQNPWWLGWEHDMQAEKIDAALDDDIARAALEGK